METSDIEKILSKGEGASIEFKEAKDKVPTSLYETVVSFSNCIGGVILLGVDDDGNVLGIERENKTKFLKDITSALNSRDNINPPLYLGPTDIEYKGKVIIAVQVPTSSQVHDHAGRIYIREYESDIDITDNQHKVRSLFLKKGSIYTENQIYPGLTMADLDESLFDKARNLIRSYRSDHPWLSVSNEQMLRDAILYRHDFEQRTEGLTLAAALIFGKDVTIQNILPAYKVEAMVRIRNKDRWDDRLTLRTNLIDTYINLKNFVYRYLPEKFYMEGDQRIDLRDKIFREIIGNLCVHREYTNAVATELLIEENAVTTINPNNPYFNGIMNLDNFNPYSKNPNIRKFFTALGWADEIGSGIRNTRKYLPLYVEKATPVFIDEQLFKTIIPLVHFSMSGFALKWHHWLELDEKYLPKLTSSLETITVDSGLYNMAWDDKILKLALSWAEKGTKSKELKWPKNQPVTEDEIKKTPSWAEKGTKLLVKKVYYLICILSMCGVPVSIDELMEIFSYQDRSNFRTNYMKPLETIGFIERTNPDKPTASNQKYYITEKGKMFLTGQDF